MAWTDLDGNRKQRSFPNKTIATEFRSTVEADLARGEYTGVSEISWDDFRDRVERGFIKRKKATTQGSYRIAIDHLERIVKPKTPAKITTRSITDYSTKRLGERGLKAGTKLSKTTLNSELRSLRAILHWANDQGYISKVPKIQFEREAMKEARYIPADEFRAIYDACHVANRPVDLPYPPEQWWQAFLVFLYLTGWRKSETLELRREDVDFENGTALTRAENNKSNRDERVPLHPMIVEHLRELPSFSPMMFPWELSHRMLYETFRRILAEAGVSEEYGFHDLRRAFASEVGQSGRQATTGTHEAQGLRNDQAVPLNMRPSMEGVTDHYAAPDLTRKSKRKPG